MKCVILAGGMGTRLAEETSIRPKPMIEIGERPILWHIMKLYTHHGVTDFIVCLGYRGYMIKEYFANYHLHSADVTIDLVGNNIEYHHRRNEPWRITLVDTGDQTMTGGRLKRVRPYLDDGAPFCMTYGDGLANIDIAAEIAFHRKHGRKATVACVRPPARFGSIVLYGCQSDRLRGKAADRKRPNQRRLFRARPVGARLRQGRYDRLGTRADGKSRRRWSACRLATRRLLAADGYPARQAAIDATVGIRKRAVEGVGSMNLVTSLHDPFNDRLAPK